jgi:hypothetical protein
MNRELVFSSLFYLLTGTLEGNAYVQAAPFPWLTAGRRRIRWDKVAAQPALFLTEGNQVYGDGPATRSRLVDLSAIVWIYAQDIDPSPEMPAAGSALSPLVDFVEQQLRPSVAQAPSRGLQTLGLSDVVFCRIEGDIEMCPGDLGAQGMAVIPIRIQVAEWR